MTKEKINFYLVVVSALILGMLTDYLFYQKSIGISFFVFNSIAIIFTMIFARKANKKISGIQYFILISILLFSVGVFLRASSFLAFFNIIGGIYLLFFFLTLFLNKNISDFRFSKYFIYPLSFLLRSFPSVSKFIRKYKNAIPKNNKSGSKELRSIIKGVIIAIPFLIIFIMLLSSADQVFQAYANKFIKIDFDFRIILRVLKVLLVSYLFLGIFSRITEDKKSEEIKSSSQRLEPTSESEKYVFLSKSSAERLRQGEKIKSAENKIKENKSSNFIESSTVLVLVELLFLSFIIIQFFYLFGGKNYVWGIEEYITYSEYAKKGFYELICVSIISFLLIFAIDEAGKKETLKEKKYLKYWALFLFWKYPS